MLISTDVCKSAPILKKKKKDMLPYPCLAHGYDPNL